jgi:hypothetical protein
MFASLFSLFLKFFDVEGGFIILFIVLVIIGATFTAA